MAVENPHDPFDRRQLPNQVFSISEVIEEIRQRKAAEEEHHERLMADLRRMLKEAEDRGV